MTLTVNAGADKYGLVYQKLTFIGTANGGTEPYTYTWRFRDSVSGPVLLTKTGQTITHSFSNAKKYYVTLTVVDNDGVSVSDTVEANIFKLVVNAGPDQTGFKYQKLTFFGLATGGTAPYTYTWKFRADPNGTVLLTKTGQTIIHGFSAIKKYYLTLIVKDAKGLTASDVVEVNIISSTVDDIIITPHDQIPNFGSHPTHRTVASGNWSNANIWEGGVLPADGAKAAVVTGHTVKFDLTTSPRFDTVSVQPGGVLTFADSKNTKMLVRNLQVLEGGEIKIINPNVNIKTEVCIIDSPITDELKWSNGVIIHGKATMLGFVKTPYIKLRVEALVGDTTLQLAAPAEGWQVGDNVFIPDSHQITPEENLNIPAIIWRGDVVTVTGVSLDKRTITVNKPLEFDHKGARNAFGVLVGMPDVGNLTRNIVFSSENGSGVRGHVVGTYNAEPNIKYVGFFNLGRTTHLALEGDNAKGRYPLHIHHIHHDESIEPRFVLEGCAVFCDMDNHPFKWGITIHDTCCGLVKNNVIYNWAGACLSLEAGTEEYNVIDGNLMVRTRFPYGTNEGNATGADEAAPFWSMGVKNYIRNNIVANCHNGYGYYFYPKGFGGTNDPILEFENNEAYGAFQHIFSPWNLGVLDSWTATYTGISYIRRMKCWHWTQSGIYTYNIAGFTFEDCEFYGDMTVVGPYNGAYPGGTVYRDCDIIMRRCIMEGAASGFGCPAALTLGGGYLILEECHFDNVIFDINVGSFNTPTQHPDGFFNPRKLVVKNCTFGTISGWKIKNTFSESFVDAVLRDELVVENYNGTGIDYKVYAFEQHKDAIMVQAQKHPEGDFFAVVGCPEAGLTNAQAWAKYGIATKGEVAPDDAVDGASLGIYGLVKRLN